MTPVLLDLAIVLASAVPTTVADAEIFALIEAGEIGRAATRAEEWLDREASARDSSPGELASQLQRVAEGFYGAGTKESIEAAERFFVRALSLRELRAAQEPDPLADLLHDLSGLYFNRGDYVDSENAERRALEIWSRIYPPEDPRTAESRRDLGLIFLAQGRLQEAASHLMGALKAIEATTPRDWTQVAVGRNYLAELYRLQGRYAEAAAVLEDVVRRTAELAGDDDPQFPYFLNNLAGVYRDQARFDAAETLLRRSLALRKAALPRDDVAVAMGTLNIAELQRAQGKLKEAEPFYLEAMQLARSALGAGSPVLFEFTNQLAVLYREQGRLEEAEPRFREALELVGRGLGPDHPRVAQSLLDLSELLRLRGRCKEAETHLGRAIRIRSKALGQDHPDVAEVLTSLSRCLAADPANRAAALASLDEAIGILGSSEAHPGVAADALAIRAELSRGTDPGGARRDLARALEIVESMRPHRGGGEVVRAEFFGRHAPMYERMVRWEIEEGDTARALLTAERGRARTLLDQLAAAHVGDAGSSRPDLEERQTAARSELAEIRQRMLFEQSRGDLEHQERLARMKDLERRLEEASRSFRELYDEARNANAAWRGAAAGETASVQEIQQEVVPREGLLLLYEIGAEGSFVFSVPPEPESIEAIPLVVDRAAAADLGIEPGPLTEKRLGAILSGKAVPAGRGASGGLLAHLSSPSGALSRGIGGLSSATGPDLGRLHALWRVLVPTALWTRVEEAREVLVIPDGPLFLLPLEALVVHPGPDLRATRFWLDAGPVLRYAPSATFIHNLGRGARVSAVNPERVAALSVSDPAYEPAGARSGSAAAPSFPESVRSAYLGSGGILSRLPGTATETRAVRAALEGIAEVSVLQGSAAREPAVREGLEGKRYLHFATHGLVDETGGDLFATLALTPPPASAPVGDDDGFLQLFEIYDLRLSAELAVLSACSSNAGRVVSGEGVFALSRGFLVAGARRVVASQWAVDDVSTAELVGELFRGVARSERAGDTIDAARALRDAKLRLRGGKPEWAHPFYWAPFVITGLD